MLHHLEDNGKKKSLHIPNCPIQIYFFQVFFQSQSTEFMDVKFVNMGLSIYFVSFNSPLSDVGKSILMLIDQ